MGKPCVIFEELPVMNKSEWNMCDSKLKDMSTGTEWNYGDTYVKKLKTNNTNKYEIHHQPQGDQKARWSSILCGGHQYPVLQQSQVFCFNETEGHAFYNYLMELDFDRLTDMPEANAKKNVTADLISPVEQFLKFEFLLKKKHIRCKPKDLYLLYEEYCENNGYRCESKIHFVDGLRQYGFNHRLIAGYNQFRICVENLQAVAVKRNWLHELDSEDIDEHTPSCTRNIKTAQQMIETIWRGDQKRIRRH